MMERMERDTIGEIAVPGDKFWGAQTERSRQNFKIGEEKMPREIIKAFARLKKATARSNADLGKLAQDKAEAIAAVCDRIVTGELDAHFPLVVWQTGSGTQSNMNVNEVVAFVADANVHPNDDVNMSQSSNDTFPTAMHIAAYEVIVEDLMPELVEMRRVLVEKKEKYWRMVKIGRTHLQDATPLTLGQEISGWESMIRHAEKFILDSSDNLLELAIGGTAVGTGLNATADFGERVAKHLETDTGYAFRSAENKFYALTSMGNLILCTGHCVLWLLI